MTDAALDLLREQDGRVVERASLDVRDLPNRPDLLARLGPVIRERLLWEADEMAKGNPDLETAFSDIQQETEKATPCIRYARNALTSSRN